MLIDWNTNRLPRGEGVDAIGRPMPPFTLMVDTETGECWHLAKGADGSFIRGPDGNLKEFCTKLVAPVTVWLFL